MSSLAGFHGDIIPRLSPHQKTVGPVSLSLSTPSPPPTESLALFLSFVDNMDIYNHTTRYT